jgi:hypothetical protein
MDDDYFDSDEWRDYVARVRAELLPKLADSALSLSLVPDDMAKADVKFMLETGAALCMDKPIILVVSPGTKIPAGLARAADEIVELALGDDAADPASVAALSDAITRVAGPPTGSSS